MNCVKFANHSAIRAVFENEQGDFRCFLEWQWLIPFGDGKKHPLADISLGVDGADFARLTPKGIPRGVSSP
jgi:hypothetical protein